MAHIRLENGRKALVLGCGTSGAAAARFLHSRGWQTTIVDTAANPSGLKLFESDASKPQFVCSDFNVSLLSDGMDLLVLSPGLSPEFSKAAALVSAAREQGAEVVGEIELSRENSSVWKIPCLQARRNRHHRHQRKNDDDRFDEQNGGRKSLYRGGGQHRSERSDGA